LRRGTSRTLKERVIHSFIERSRWTLPRSRPPCRAQCRLGTQGAPNTRWGWRGERDGVRVPRLSQG